MYPLNPEKDFSFVEVAWKPNSSHVWGVDYIGRLTVWDSALGTILYTNNILTKSIVFNANGSYCAIGLIDGGIEIRNADTFSLERTFGSELEINHLEWRNKVILGVSVREIKLWDDTDFTAIYSFQANDNTFNFTSTLSHVGKYIVNIVEDDRIEITEIKTSILSGYVNMIGNWYFRVAWDSLGTRVSSSNARKIKVWNSTSGNIEQTLNIVPSQPFDPKSISWQKSDSMLAIGLPNVELWNMLTLEKTRTLPSIPNIEGFNGLSWSPNRQSLAGLTDNGYLLIWAYPRGELKFSVKAHVHSGNKLEWNSASDKIVTIGSDKSDLSRFVKLWNVDIQNNIYRIDLIHVFDTEWDVMAWKPDGLLLILKEKNSDKLIGISPITLQKIEFYLSGADQIELIQWQPNGNLLAGVSGNRIYIWDTNVPQSAPIQSFQASEGRIYDLVWSPSGLKFATIGSDETLRIFSAAEVSTPMPTPSPTPTPRPDTIGVYRPATSTFFPRYSNSTGLADVSFQFGNPPPAGYYDYNRPVSGDWNGDGIDTVGLYVYHEAKFYLKNANTAGVADLSFNYGIPGDAPLAGRWDASATQDSVGTYRYDNGTMYLLLKNTLGTGVADQVIVVGNPGDFPVVGDWNGDGIDTIALHRYFTDMVYVFNQSGPGTYFTPDEVFRIEVFGSFLPLSGNWTATDRDGIGFYDAGGGQFYLKHTASAGPPEIGFSFGTTNDRPIAGRWR